MAVIIAVSLALAVSALTAPPALRLFCRTVDRHLDEAFDPDQRRFQRRRGAPALSEISRTSLLACPVPLWHVPRVFRGSSPLRGQPATALPPFWMLR